MARVVELILGDNMPHSLSRLDLFANKDTKITIVKAAKRSERSFGAAGGDILVQFPPKLTSDSKTGSWMLYDAHSYEEIAAWMGAKSRSITLEVEYVAHDTGGWGAIKIAEQVRKFKSYFYEASAGAMLDAPAFKLKIYDIIPTPDMTWRSEGVNIDYSDEIIQDGGFFWPLYTKVKLNLRMYTNLLTRKNAPNKDKLQLVPHLYSGFKPGESESTKWY